MTSLTPEQFQLLDRLFHQLQDLSAEKRRARLSEIASEDPLVHQELLLLLDDATVLDRQEQDLEQLAAGAAALSSAETESVENSTGSTDASQTDSAGEVAALEAAEGAMLGRYKLLRRLGIGGMGEVWEAQQNDPVTRRVAVKILRQDYSTRDSAARFRLERQALATMDHPHIATVFDGGETQGDQPYFVMELVEGGIALTQYCARHGLTLEQRLRLFLPICEAVEHAHRKRIIHRDLKPSNVLVTEVAGVATPKVIDFGIAKPLEQALSQGDDHATRIGELVGTPEYMSPEQAALGSIDIDTRSDVYTLGLLLYELLVGELPMTGRELRKLPFDELCRRIREDATPKPSTKIRQSGDANTAPTGTTWRRVQGDLDRILGKALAKDREQRYGSAKDLAEDVRRFLDNEPVLATPPSFAYQATKFLRRNRLAVSLAGIALLALIVALVGVSFGLLRAQRAERLAETEARTASRVSTFLEELLREGNPEQAQGALDIAGLLDIGATKIRTELADEPEVRSRLLFTVASAHQALGEYPEALELLEESETLRSQLHGENSEEMEQLLDKKAETLQRVGRLDEGLAAAQRQRDIADSIFDDDDPARARSRLQVGIAHWRKGSFDQALVSLEDALALRQRTQGEDHAELPGLLNNVAILYWQSARYDEAGKLYRQALAIQRRNLGNQHPHVASTLNNLALVYENTDQPQQAIELHREALSIRREIFEEPHPDIAESLNNLASGHEQLDDFDTAIALLEEALVMRNEIFEEPNDYIASTALNLGRLLSSKDPARARQLLEGALASFESTLGPDHVNVSYALLDLANFEHAEGRFEEAEHMVRRGVELRERALGPEHPLLEPALAAFVTVLESSGRTEEARAVRQRHQQLKATLETEDGLDGNTTEQEETAE